LQLTAPGATLPGTAAERRSVGQTVCYFVAIGIRRGSGALVEALSQGREASFRVDVCINSSIADLFGPDDSVYFLTRGQCSCDLYVEPGSASDPTEERSRAEARYRRKGWSQNKIERALQSMHLPSERSGRRTGVGDLLNSVAHLVEEAGSVRLFAHFFSGAITTEEVKATGRETISLEAFRTRAGSFASDILLEIGRGAGQQRVAAGGPGGYAPGDRS
jgi:hypothetical protein